MKTERIRYKSGKKKRARPELKSPKSKGGTGRRQSPDRVQCSQEAEGEVYHKRVGRLEAIDGQHEHGDHKRRQNSTNIQ